VMQNPSAPSALRGFALFVDDVQGFTRMPPS
jgi:hypothetical protein